MSERANEPVKPRAARVVGDLVIGIRLAVGGGRTSMARLMLSTVGIALAVAVLLLGASVGTMSGNHEDRLYASLPTGERTDVAPMYYLATSRDFRDKDISVTYVRPSGPDSPKPQGLPTIPADGEMYASPALVALLNSSDGDLLRPRLAERVVGVLDDSLVPNPDDLMAWVGADESLARSDSASRVYAFGRPTTPLALDPRMLTLLLIGAVALLLPVFVFVSSASRIAGAERDRRLSALRLVGAGARQVRRIAAAEALVSAVAGLVLGAALFLVGRQFAENVNLFGQQAYVDDVVPNPVLVVLIVLLIPAVSVLTALVAQRRTIIEPLGVVRQSKPVRRRAWWRLAIVALGVVLLITQLGAEENTDVWVTAVVCGAVFLLLGVQVVLPWLVERVVGHMKHGPSSWLLAIRRLQLDSGTSARVVGGVAVVLAATITVQTMLLSLEEQPLVQADDQTRTGVLEATADLAVADAVLTDIRNADGVADAHAMYHLGGEVPGESDTWYSLVVLDCAALADLGGVRTCEDGDVFAPSGAFSPAPEAGATLEFRDYVDEPGMEWNPEKYEVTGSWEVPDTVRTVTLSPGPLYGDVFVTPGALDPGTLADRTTIVSTVDPNVTSDQLEKIRNSVAEYSWRVDLVSYDTGPDRSVGQATYVSIRNALYAGSIFTLMLAGVSMLVLALEHIRERRRSLAVLTASGVPRGVLSRSLLWQVALPIVLGVVVALATGIGLAALMMRLVGEPMNVDWPGVAVLCAGATVLTLLVSAMTLPFLKSATRLTTLRAE